MNKEVHQKLINTLSDVIYPITDNSYINTLMEHIGDASYVLIGEATHGTEEFYQARIEITKKLIEEKGFNAVAIEGDWPDTYHIHRYLMGFNASTDMANALSQFKRFPTWMWCNTTIPPFLSWLRSHNDDLALKEKVGFYGLDLYNMHTSIDIVINYLKKVDPKAAKLAEKRYGCFDYRRTDPQTYGYLINVGIKKSCVKEVVGQLLELQHQSTQYLKRAGIKAEDEYFTIMQNARLIKDAERYYRAMFEDHISSWNIRDRHMADTVNTLADHIEQRSKHPAKIIVWAHNSHVGDARATEMGARGELNLGQLMREQYFSNTFSIGFSSYMGTVTAASTWGAPVEKVKLNPGLDGSYEALFHDLTHENFMLLLNNSEILDHYLKIPRLQRAVGVIYRPDSERVSHYFLTHLPYQFDCIIHFDKTTALTPLNY